MHSKSILAIILTFIALASSILALPTYIRNTKPAYIPNQYIIAFNEDVRIPNAEIMHFLWLEDKIREYRRNNRDIEADEFGVLHKYNIASEFKGYAAKLPDEIISLVENMPNIKYIEADSLVHASTIQPKAGSWSLSRISQRELPLNASYTYPDKAGAGVTAYVIDTGVDVAHPDFEGRASWGKSFSKDGEMDGNGHGTHVAGTIASATYGVAKKANIIAVKVLDNSGSGSYATVLAGINWMSSHATNNSLVGKALANMSLGGGKSQAVNDAVAAAVKAGFPFIVAAGNSYKADACTFSPASEPTAYTVAASDINDKLASFSNVGKCVDIIAPGVNITSTWMNSTTKTISGTSMAAPTVAGVFALAMAEMSFASPQEVYDFITARATTNAIKDPLSGTVNLLAFNGIDVFQTSEEIIGTEGEYPEFEAEDAPVHDRFFHYF